MPPRRHLAREEREPSTTARPRRAGRSRITVPGNRGVKVVRRVAIHRAAHELYAFWRDVENLPRVIRHPVSVAARSRDESHWSMRAPTGKDYEWDSLIINDEPDRLIAWRTRQGAAVAHAGTIRFEPTAGGNDTEVTIQLEYDARGGKVGQWLAKLAGAEPGQQIDDTLRRFKTLMESNEGNGASGTGGAMEESRAAASAAPPLQPRRGNPPLIGARKLATAEVRARDGVVGTVDDLLLDDAMWTVRYLIVDTGVWLAGRRVLLAPLAVNGHAADSNSLNVGLTREQIRTSPLSSPVEEVTRADEARLHEHYRWPPYWVATPMAGGIVPPPAAFERPEPRREPPPAGDPHLHSARHVRGYHVVATDGDIGAVEDFLVEPRSWRVAFVIVDTNGWLPGGKALLEPHTIDRVSRTEAKVFVHESRAVVKTHPPYSPDQVLDAEYLTGLQRHFQHPPIM
ncbi:MAG: SRPBCC family protein [Opitutae bacterium]|nr:SRPBCC family protein [Opitutae bacterium]